MVNAWEDGDWIVMTAASSRSTIRRDRSEGQLASMLAYLRYKGHLRRWRMNCVPAGAGAAARRPETSSSACPTTELYGVKSAVYTSASRPPADLAFDPLVKYDHERGTREVCEYEAAGTERGPVCEEHARRRRGHGYVVTLATNVMDTAPRRGSSTRSASRAHRPRAHPRTRRAGFHACWIPARPVAGRPPPH